MVEWGSMTSKLRGRTLRVLVAGVLLLGAGVVWWLYPRPSDRELIAEVVRRAEHGVETKDVGEIMSCVSPDYRDSEGLTRTQVLRLALAWSRERQQAHVSIEDYQLTLAPPEATATLLAAVALSGVEAPRPMEARVRFRKIRRGLGRVWVVEAVEGHHVGSMIEGTE